MTWLGGIASVAIIVASNDGAAAAAAAGADDGCLLLLSLLSFRTPSYRKLLVKYKKLK